MSIRPIRKAVSLPSVKLYLEDIEKISSLFREETTNAPQASCDVCFVADERECDTIADLRELGGMARKFEIRMRGGSSLSLSPSFGWYFHPGTPSVDLKVRRIFENRTSWRKPFYDLPAFWEGTLGLLLISLCSYGLLFSALFARGLWRPVLVGCCVLVSYLVYRLTSIHSLVAMRYSHDRADANELVRVWVAPMSVALAAALAIVLLENYVHK